MSSRLKKTLLLLLAGLLLGGTFFVQRSLNADRNALGLTRVEPLENAPPVLAFTTVALGGFRGLISNALWIRANDLQDEDKFFEMAQLADWITKLEPHFVQVWLVQAWNMAYNISVKFKDYPDRWRWVKRGVELLRDEGLPLNPNEVLIYRELAWFFQHKMGQNLDDASLYYKQQWANEMAQVFAKKAPNLDELINPQTTDQSNRLHVLRTKYKMDPRFMKEVDERFGPLEWRLPESHAIYWAYLGLKNAEKNPSKIKKDDLITLHRVIYQSMQMSFHRGKLIANPFTKTFQFGPNLAIVPKVSKAYEDAADEDADNREHILRAHRNFLRDAVYFLYEHNRLGEAQKWYTYLAKKFPDKPVIDGKANSLPANVSMEEYAIYRVAEDIDETSKDRVQAAVEGLLTDSYMALVLDDEERYAGYKLLAQKIYTIYMGKVPQEREQALTLGNFQDIAKSMLDRLLDPQEGLPPEARAVLRTRLGLPAETPAKPDGQPTTAAAASATNAPAQVAKP